MSDGISYHASFECETTEEALALMKAVFGINERFGIPNGGGENESSRALVATVGGDGGMGVDITSESKGAFRALSEELAAAGGLGHLAAVAYDAAEVRTETAEPAENPLTPREFSIQNPDKHVPVNIPDDGLDFDYFLKSEAGSFGEYSLEIKFPTQALAENAMVSADTSGLKMDLTYSGMSSDTWLTIRGDDERVPLVNVVEVLKEEAGVECLMSPESFYENGNLHVLADMYGRGLGVERDYNNLAMPVEFTDYVPALKNGTDAGMFLGDAKRMGLGDFLDRHGDARDGGYAMFEVSCKDIKAADHLDYELQKQYARFHPDASTNVCDMGRIFAPDMGDEYELFYGEWNPMFLEDAAELLQNTADLCGTDSMRVRIIGTDVVGAISRELEAEDYPWRLERKDIDLPDKLMGEMGAVQISYGGNDENGVVVSIDVLDMFGVRKGVEWLEGLDREYDNFNFDWEGIKNGKISLGDSRGKLCCGPGDHGFGLGEHFLGPDVYGHDFSSYRVVFRDLSSLEGDAVETICDHCDELRNLSYADADDVNGWKVSVRSTSPEIATVLGNELKTKGIECTVSGAYTFATGNELVLEAVARHENGIEMSEADYRTKPDGAVAQTGEPKLESFASAVEREQAEARKQQPTAPQRKNGVEKNRGMDVAM